MEKEAAKKVLKEEFQKLGGVVSFANAETLYNYFKPWLTRNDIIKFLQSRDEYTKQRKFNVKFQRNYTYVPRRRYMLQADLKSIFELSKANKNYNFILVCIDCFTRKAWCHLLKTKNENEVVPAFESLLPSIGKFNHLVTDKG